jgi:hypothetical protein
MRIAILSIALLGAVLASAQAGAYDELRIVAPAEDATVHDNQGNVSITVSVVPALQAQAGDRIVLLLDGRSAASGTGGQFTLTGVDRGTHTLAAQVTAADGAVRIASAPITFHMWRASRRFPSRDR